MAKFGTKLSVVNESRKEDFLLIVGNRLFLRKWLGFISYLSIIIVALSPQQ